MTRRARRVGALLALAPASRSPPRLRRAPPGPPARTRSTRRTSRRDGRERRLGRRRRSRSRSRSPAASRTATGTSRCARASGSIRSPSPRAAGASCRARRRRSAPGGPPGSFGIESRRRPRPHRLAVPGGHGDADVHAPVSDPRAGRRLRRRRGREPQGLGRRVAAVARASDRTRRSAPATSCAPGAIPRGCAATSCSRAATRSSARSTSPPTSSSSCARSTRAARSRRPRACRCGTAPASTRSWRRRRPTRPGTSATRTAIDDAQAHPARTALILLALGTLPAALLIGARLLDVRAGAADRVRPRVRAGASDRDRAGARAHAPAPGREPGSFEFTATLFDLIRRGRLPATPRDDRARGVGRAADRADRRPRALAR